MNEHPAEPDRAPPRQRPRLPAAWWAAIALAAAVVAATRLLPRRAERPVETPPRRVPVRVLPASAEGVRDVLDLPGRVEPIYAATLGAERAGRIVEIAADRGARVRAGDPVARIANEVWKARREQAEIELREAVRDLERREALARTGAIAAHELDAARARADRARAALAEAAEYLRQCTIAAPVNGEITDRFVEAGEHVAEGQAVARLVDVAKVRVVFEVPERRIGDVPVGTPVRVIAEDDPPLVLTAVVATISAEADPRSHTYRADIQLDNPEGRLRAGRIVRVEIDRPLPPGWVAVPIEAVIPRRGEYIVFVVTDGRAMRRRVELERIAGSSALLSWGVVAGESVVVEGQRDLADGSAVEVVARPEPAS